MTIEEVLEKLKDPTNLADFREVDELMFSKICVVCSKVLCRGSRSGRCNKHKIVTEATKEKIKQYQLGTKKPWATKTFKGKKLSQEQIDKIVKANKGIPRPKWRGENSSNWKGGISKKPGYKAHQEMRRKIKKKGNGGYHTLKEWEDLKKRFDFTCLNCKKQEPEIVLTRDHMLSIKNGGPDFIANIQPLCTSCNSRKRANSVDYKSIWYLRKSLMEMYGV